MYSDTSRVRKRTPVVKVSLESDPDRVLSMTVPKSKSWVEFLEKCAQKFEVDVRHITQIVELVDEDECAREFGDTMKKVKHGTCFQIILAEAETSSEEEIEAESDSIENEEIYRQPLDLFQRISHLKKKHQKRRREAWKVVKQKLWKLDKIESTDSANVYISDNYRIEISKAFLRVAPEEVRVSDLKDRMICIILCHGGRFAAGIFRGAQLQRSKKYQRYVVRKGQGRRQMAYSKNKANGSAGGWLRTFHEKKLHEDIIELLSSWRESLDECETILIHAPGNVNQATIFNEDSPIERGDERIVKLQIQTNVVNSSEVKRIHFATSMMYLVEVQTSVS